MKGYLVTADLNCTSVNKTYCKPDFKEPQNLITSTISCGDTITNSFKQMTNIILIQNSGTSSVTFTAKAVTKSDKKNNLIIIIIGVVAGIAVIGIIIWAVRRNMVKRNLAKGSLLIA